ncbi:unnamed protein product [Rotaria sp. Silwood2]|nr:unnamed protein product [Rotaria sp. Silwood2]
MTAPVITPDEIQIVTTLEINDDLLRKKSNHHENETLTGNNVQALAKKDISLFINKDCIPTGEIYAALIDPWKPSIQYKFPQVNKNQKMRSVCQHSWLTTYPWLSYSSILQGVLCRYCILFQRKSSPNDPAKNALGQLVVKPLTSLNKANEYFRSHEKTDYHLFSKEQAELFINNYTDTSKSIDHILDSEYQQQEASNRKILSSIIKCILFIGKQNLAFRGHDDDGIDHKSTGLGNFKELILFRVESGDTILDDHLKTCSKNAMYMSPKIQNELISICADIIRAQIVSNIIEKKSFFSVLVDATSDVAGVEQMSLSIRYLCNDDDRIVITEDFIGFIPITDSSAKGQSELIISFLQSAGLDLAYLRGQGYDGCAVMSGHIGGVQKLILDIAPKALYVHCASHSLDLAICDACDDRNIQLLFGTVKTVIKFISASPKRQSLLKNAVKATQSDTKRKKLAKLVEHRWVEKHTSILVFKQLFSSVVVFLEYMVETADLETSANSRAYLKSIRDLDFVICLFVVSRVFGILKPYTEMLQSKTCDLIQCYDNIQEVALHLADLKYNDDKINELVNDLKSFSEDNDIKLEISRTNKYRTVIDYLKCIYGNFIDTTLRLLEQRFSKHQQIAVNIVNLLPSTVVDKKLNDVIDVFKFYRSDLRSNNIDVVIGEFEMWQQKWKKIPERERPANIINTLTALVPVKEFYPNLNCLFQIFAILPVTVATAERSFSTMKRIKTTLRNSISDKRLSDLAVIHIHRDKSTNLNVENIINIFCKDKRRIKFTD